MHTQDNPVCVDCQEILATWAEAVERDLVILAEAARRGERLPWHEDGDDSPLVRATERWLARVTGKE